MPGKNALWNILFKCHDIVWTFYATKNKYYSDMRYLKGKGRGTTFANIENTTLKILETK